MGLDGSESILCYPADVVREHGPWTGFRDYDAKILQGLDEAANFLPRTDELERDLGLVQAVVYGYVVSASGGDDKILVYRRATAGSEERLHGMLSIGVGGHIDASDRGVFETTKDIGYRAMLREFREELGVAADKLRGIWYGSKIVGLIHNQDEYGVGAHHLGIVFEVRIGPETFCARECEQAVDFVGWWSKSQLLHECNRDPAQFESWTQEIIRGRFLKEVS